ncbi:MAG: GntR family transcriptional regulator [Gammaproteobacteria bacterium]|nr:GntR family transcriptional regulator [Gammaproteobacteria bacterium]
MLQPEALHSLTIVDITEKGMYLNAGEQQLLFVHHPESKLDAANQSLEGKDIGDKVNVFVYRDGQQKLQATLEKPLCQVNQFAKLEVTDVNQIGAFVDWGIAKELLIPFGEQIRPLKVGQRVVVYVYHNRADSRLVASTRVDKHLDRSEHNYKKGDKVELLALDPSDLGMKVIVDHKFSGLIHNDDLHQKLTKGQNITGFIKTIRHDNKLDIQLTPPGVSGIDSLGQKIIEKLKDNNGELFITDKSSPEVIKKIFGVSKKQYKNALGNLYKNRIILIEPKKVILINQ